LLREEVGTVPSSVLVELERRIATGAESSAATHVASAADVGGRTVTDPHVPPAPWTSLVGRDAGIAAATELVECHRLITLTGAGGQSVTSGRAHSGAGPDRGASRPVG